MVLNVNCVQISWEATKQSDLIPHPTLEASTWLVLAGTNVDLFLKPPQVIQRHS